MMRKKKLLNSVRCLNALILLCSLGGVKVLGRARGTPYLSGSGVVAGSKVAEPSVADQTGTREPRGGGATLVCT